MSQPEYLQTIMPKVYSPDDAKWIQDQLQRFTASARHKVVALYADVYQAAWDEEPVSFRQENRARHEANTRLREFVKSHSKALQGYTAEPPLAGKR